MSKTKVELIVHGVRKDGLTEPMRQDFIDDE